MSPKSSNSYSAASLTVLKGLEAVRKRPGMYIGDNGSRGLTHLVYEVVDNAVDEALGGFCTRIEVTLHADGSVEVWDNGRGIPVDIEPKSGIPGAILVLTELHAGGKFGGDGSGYDVAGGLHGVGVTAVNALSSRVELEIDRDGCTNLISFKEGVPGQYGKAGEFAPSNTVRKGKKVAKDVTGTRVRFWPALELFARDAALDREAISARIRQTAFLVPGLQIVFRDELADPDVEEVFEFTGGLSDLVSFRNPDPPLAGAAPLAINGEGTFAERVTVVSDDGEALTDVERTCRVEVALLWGNGFDPNVTSFVNIVHTPAGGTHLAGFEAAVVKAVNEQLKAQRVARAKDQPVVRDDVLEGLTAAVVVKLAEPQFIGQTKDKLGTPAVQAIVSKVVYEQLTTWLTGTKTKLAAKAVLEKIQNASRTRLAAREVRTAQRRKTALENASMPSKLVDCRSEDSEMTELFIVEGDSALGTFKGGRDSEYQAALPVRGKILNVHGVTQSRMLENAECAAIIQVMGAGFGKSFNSENLRYGKLIALCDADVDGAHIRSLLLTFCYKYMRPLLEEGRFYSAVPPLHRIEVTSPKKETIYTYSDEELKVVLADLERAGKRVKEGDGIQRYKGLGEMDADQLAETTLIPEHRHLRRATLDDGKAASDAFDLCMGSDVPPRRDFIMEEGGLLDPHLIDA